MKSKEEILKGLDYLYQKKPSEWNAALILRFKMHLLPDLITFISANDNNICTKVSEGVTSQEAETILEG
ncbi:hypothetical protein M0R04_16050 [Candidatus Dojkabacteria bacterium]|jgi:hypothetical protein|nr:hypothetical protein [Candidatus Dojkabacteria bacterium]